MSIELRRVGPYIYDLFQGNQWSTWSRVRKGRSSTFVMAGEKLPHSLLKDLDGILHPRFPINNQPLHITVNNLNAINTVKEQQ